MNTIFILDKAEAIIALNLGIILVKVVKLKEIFKFFIKNLDI